MILLHFPLTDASIIPHLSPTVPYRAVCVLAHICGSLLAPPNIRYYTCVFWQTILYIQPLSHARNRSLCDLAETLVTARSLDRSRSLAITLTQACMVAWTRLLYLSIAPRWRTIINPD